MEIYDVLIVEDEANIADFHSYYLQQTQRFRPIGIAKNIAEAKKMIQLLKPKLVLLDNYLPDGKGIDLLKDITATKHSPDVIFITAANDMETVREGVRCGAFDYLLKPISYDRLTDSLQRYLKYTSSLKANDNINQRHVDELFNFQSKSSQMHTLPKGIDELTLDKVIRAFDETTIIYTAELLGNTVGISKTTARRYLEFLVAQGFLFAEIQHGKVGRPERVYQKKK
ncbi:response regulator [Vibrio sp. V27_P1S3P104]|uniref:response regulator n=1 Tax=Vibrio TaxID=662 RepID=UPI000C170DE8|nr:MULTISPECIES: response regulator [Vibrio]NAW67823.1 response regulator [Vibrio sp. V28_P6S34P95]NAX04482.1 response regulator [Vibrio sp. V30_P3S12P165]NAX33165.1 response regulator [Vibrio sp. V29_P1S30P107]NAX37499.1 response regulator [Vibrio sp. V27_P1S3P104]NAX40909.1 response regulator [Vibrio sp. V26_P1S5P106]